jgi:hypothetical protein
VEAAFLAGYRHALEQYAWWKDGEQLVGVGRFRLSDVMKAAPEECREAYKSFLDKQKVRHDGTDE